MSYQNERYILRLADSSDNKGISSVFAHSSFDGGISVQYLREPDPYESFLADGTDARIFVVIDRMADKTCAVGGAVLRDEFVNRRLEKCAYLTGLKIHPDYQRKIPFIARAYRLLHEELAGCRLAYTTILDDNSAAIALFEKHHRNMPEYRYLGHYTTYCFHGGKKCLDIAKNDLSGFDQLLKSHFSAQSLVPADPGYAGFGQKTFYCVREDDEILACCFVGSQREHKQYKMCAYGGIYKTLSKLPTRLLGYPAFPKASAVIDHGAVSYLYVKDCDPKLCASFLRTVAAEAGFSLLIWGGFENNPLCTALDRMKTIHYGSRLYAVLWDDGSPEKPLIPEGIIGMEAALL